MAAPKGHPRYGGGRVKGQLNKKTLLLAAILDEVAAKAKFDWVYEFIDDFKTGNIKRKDYWSMVLPLLCAKPTVTPIELDSAAKTPAQSKAIAEENKRLIDKLEADAIAGANAESH
jgi:hypothetical protein